MTKTLPERRTISKLKSRVQQARPSDESLLLRRATECLAITMIGDGVLAFLEPQRHVGLWRRGPEPWQQMVRPFEEHPQLTRWLGAAEFAFGLWLASRQLP